MRAAASGVGALKWLVHAAAPEPWTLAFESHLLHALNDVVTHVDCHLIIDFDSIWFVPFQSGVDSGLCYRCNLLAVDTCTLSDHLSGHHESMSGKLRVQFSSLMLILTNNLFHLPIRSHACDMLRFRNGFVLIHKRSVESGTTRTGCISQRSFSLLRKRDCCEQIVAEGNCRGGLA